MVAGRSRSPARPLRPRRRPTIVAARVPDVLDVHQRYAGRVSLVGVAGLDDQPNMQPFVDSTKTGDLTHLADPDGAIWQRFKVTSDVPMS
jgi:hypothetical protein